jgi:hypothetical protein
MVMSVVGKRLSDYPEIAAQLDPERNGGITTREIVAGSDQKYWWRCDKGPDHVWEAGVGSRTRSGAGCPCCTGQKVSVTNSLVALYPAVASQLDPELNDGVTAGQVLAGTQKKYWWRCDKGPDHVWAASVRDRAGRGNGCPCCRGLQVSVTNSLAVLYPEIASQLDPERNGSVGADKIVAGSGKKYWWRCDKGPDHVWEAAVGSRTRDGRGCPCCSGRRLSATNSLVTLYPEVATQLDPKLNGAVSVAQILVGSNKKYWWRCNKGPDHVWETTVASRTTAGSGCPCCVNLQISVTNSLATLFPEVAGQLDSERNGGVHPSQIVASSGKKYWWRCDKSPDHVWEATVTNRTGRGTGCPYCSRQRVSATKNLATRFPEIAAQLDPYRNSATADQIAAGASEKYWWRCDEGPDHVWEASAGSRTRGGTGCPCCSGQQISVTNSLATLFPEVANQLDTERNGAVTAAEIVAGSNEKYWWRCDKSPDHVWKAGAGHRTGRGSRCLYCAGRDASVTNSLADRCPEVAAQLDPDLNGGTTAERIPYGSNKKYWWRCDKGPDHVWETGVAGRTKDGRGCPFCSGRQATDATSLAALYPEIAAQLDPERNSGISASRVTSASSKKYWWRCDKGPDHVWEASVASRTRLGAGCPCCFGRQASVTNSLAVHYPHIAGQLDSALNNGVTAAEIPSGSAKKYWWRCDEGSDHLWVATAAQRTGKSTGCPACTGRQSTTLTNLAALYPEVAAQLDPQRNGGVIADQIPAGSGRTYWWRCDKGPDHMWKSRVVERTTFGQGCPGCSGQQISVTNSLATRFPEIAAELDSERNSEVTADQIVAGTSMKYWWRCNEGPDHVWEASTASRTSLGTGCPRCNKGWMVDGLREFLRGLRAHLGVLPPQDLYAICRSNGLLRSAQSKFAKRLLTGEIAAEELDAFIDGRQDPPELDTTVLVGFGDELEGGLDGTAGRPEDEVGLGDEEIAAEVAVGADDVGGDEPPLPLVSSDGILAAAGAIVFADSDDETVDYLVASAVARIWGHAYRDEAAALAETGTQRSDVYAERVRQTFRAQHDAALSLAIPAGYDFRPGSGTDLALPNLMQRRVASQVVIERRVGNWSGTGAGKTLSAVLSSRAIGAELTVICCPNSTVGVGPDGRPDGEGWIAVIRNAFPDSEVAWKTWEPRWTGDGADDWRDGGVAHRPRYLVMNYEQFQNPDSEGRIARFLETEHPDMVIVDEIHFAKQRYEKQMSTRKRLVAGLVTNAAKTRPALAVLGMSATPVINNLQEGRSLVELITGEAHDDLPTKITLDNCLALHQRLVRLGSRWMPQWEPIVTEREVPIDCGAVLEEVRRAGKSRGFDPLKIEQILTRVRIPAIVAAIEPGEAALVYTHYVDGIVEPLVAALRDAGHRTSVFTGDERHGLADFRAGRADVLVASSAIATGVDGLQYRASKLIINCLPWTSAEYEQVKGRLIRQGQHAQTVDVIVPVTFADNDGVEWSWCRSRLARNRWKASVADAAVDGVIPKGVIESESSLVARSMRALEEWLARVETGDTVTISRQLLDIALDPGELRARTARYGDFSVMNGRWNHTRSTNLHERLANDPTEWEQYHRLYRERRKEWSVVPAITIAERLARRAPGLRVADLGCGEMILADALNGRHVVLGFDHVALDDRVTACDISALPLEDESVDVAVLSLALMGANCADYLREAHRTLRFEGQLWLAEAVSRIDDEDAFAASLERLGFDLVGHPERSAQFIFVRCQRADRQPVPGAELAWRADSPAGPPV